MGGIEVLSYASFFLTVDQNYQEREKRKESEKNLDLRNRTEVEFRKFELVRMWIEMCGRSCGLYQNRLFNTSEWKRIIPPKRAEVCLKSQQMRSKIFLGEHVPIDSPPPPLQRRALHAKKFSASDGTVSETALPYSYLCPSNYPILATPLLAGSPSHAVVKRSEPEPH